VSEAHHFRSQAELYFELARRMSVVADAEYCRVIGERNLSRAIDLENDSDLENDPNSMPRPTSRAQRRARLTGA
jgi:hypothetical protein